MGIYEARITEQFDGTFRGDRMKPLKRTWSRVARNLEEATAMLDVYLRGQRHRNPRWEYSAAPIRCRFTSEKGK